MLVTQLLMAVGQRSRRDGLIGQFKQSGHSHAAKSGPSRIEKSAGQVDHVGISRQAKQPSEASKTTAERSKSTLRLQPSEDTARLP